MTRMAPRRDIDGNGDGSMSWPCLPLAPHVGIVSRSWCSVPSWRTAWSTDSPDRSRTWIRQHIASLPDVVGDVNPQVWPVMVTGHVEACLLPSRRQKSDPDSSFHIRSGWRLRGPLCWACASAQGRARALGVGRGRAPHLGVEADPMPRGRTRRSLRPSGLGEAELALRGSDGTAVTPLNRPGEVIVDDHESPFFGYLNIVT
jgi:hypothetical protein